MQERRMRYLPLNEFSSGSAVERGVLEKNFANFSIWPTQSP
jgi:hypothetical protein